MKVFVAGLSRSGKTSRAERAAYELPYIDYISVSQILRRAGGIIPVQSVNAGLLNQRIALEYLSAFPVGRPHQLIDGHALIETQEGPLIVPDWFFKELSPNLMIYVYDNPYDISLRRTQIAIVNSIAEIDALSAIEKAACSRIADKFGIRLINLESPTPEEFIDQLRRHLE